MGVVCKVVVEKDGFKQAGLDILRWSPRIGEFGKDRVLLFLGMTGAAASAAISVIGNELAELEEELCCKGEKTSGIEELTLVG
ncbi:hypothetical protein LWI28_027060 [Acer negundo]|uniref:Uncharacterized protein n=1 Tax=Acer negundo TaxID=4023 RepID=A0AAD5J891_ACENE|nr:hypothetical protein LWI28_027060 [Acer negundo]